MGTPSINNSYTLLSVMNSNELIPEEAFPNLDADKHHLMHCYPRYRAAIVIILEARRRTPLPRKRQLCFKIISIHGFDIELKCMERRDVLIAHTC
jgi:hypothetical protein